MTVMSAIYNPTFNTGQSFYGDINDEGRLVLITHLSAVLLQLGGIHSFQNRFHRLALAPSAANTVHPNTVFMLERAPLLHLRIVS